ncbi:hypothetical protein Rhal01_03019 [Rubritalea halochordaticola]|uniref:Restriction endonuclease type II NgoFVII N-terminal domain-containing protein n=1 Tax=Rubritalea halochordaticola TaxID=714537 RepID=A0ABP9V647_9BACT
MPEFSIITPLDQPTGKRRLLEDLKSSLKSDEFNEFTVIVAYAKSGPLLRLEEHLENWKKDGGKSRIIIGVDQQGTSIEAVELSLSNFDEVYITQEKSITFHPKIYAFKGNKKATAFIGSNNLTVGGTEMNFEAAIELQLALPEEESKYAEIESCWYNLMPAQCPATKKVTEEVFKELCDQNIIVPEKSLFNRSNDTSSLTRSYQSNPSGLKVILGSPLPRPRKARPAKQAKKKIVTVPPIANKIDSVKGFAIQIKPHHNGEIFLSVTAALQKPSFFEWPFKGQSVPKKTGNPSYPQRDPDPVVDIAVYSDSEEPILVLNEYKLNTVYYEKKSEIRITASPLVKLVPEYSVMIMEPSTKSGIDYNIVIYCPNSPHYKEWVDACNQEMPGGGKTPRKYGWF